MNKMYRIYHQELKRGFRDICPSLSKVDWSLVIRWRQQEHNKIQSSTKTTTKINIHIRTQIVKTAVNQSATQRALITF